MSSKRERFDPFGTDSGRGEYSPDKFYTASTDDKGHHAALRTTSIPPYIQSAMREIIEQRYIPEYRQMGDIVRDALVHRLQYLKKHHPRLSELGRLILAQENMERRLQIRKEAIRLAERCAEVVKASISVGDTDEAKEAIAEFLEALVDVDEKVRDQATRIITTQFPQLVNEVLAESGFVDPQ